MKKIFIHIVVIFSLLGCSTPYQKRTTFAAMGGYYEQKLSQSKYRVWFEGNGFTETKTASDYAMLRCAEIAIENGKVYFEVLNGLAEKKTEWYPGVYAPSSSRSPRAEFIVKLYDSEPNDTDNEYYKADAVAEEIRKRHGISKDK